MQDDFNATDSGYSLVERHGVYELRALSSFFKLYLSNYKKNLFILSTRGVTVKYCEGPQGGRIGDFLKRLFDLLLLVSTNPNKKIALANK